MEKLLTTEERIRRAEELYARRKNQQLRNHTATVNVNDKKNLKLLRKVILQILVCSMIYYFIFSLQNTSYFSSPENREKLRQILSYDINFQTIYQNVKSSMINLQKEEEFLPEEQQENKEENQTLQEATLSATEVVSQEEIEETEGLTQMEKDAKEIKENYSLVKPIEGQISSLFGQRESTNPIISTNHLGIDIAAAEGTRIKAAMEGTVTIATNSSSYRKLHKSRKWGSIYDLCTL